MKSQKNKKSSKLTRTKSLAKTKGEDGIKKRSDAIQKKPSKHELKTVIEDLHDEPRLITVRKALKYVPHYMKSQGLTKKLLKELIKLWSEAGERIRVACLLCLVRIYSKVNDKELKELILKKLYASFLEKCRITKEETMAMIGFMRHSLIELYKLDSKIALKQAQTSCQQLSVTLKNAYSHKNEETYKTVLNWQFANCLILLSSLISSQDSESPVKALTHQVIQLNLGAINFLTSPRYYPFYTHLIDNLILLSQSSGLFIPIMPLMMNILTKIDCPYEPKASKNESKQSKGNTIKSDDGEESEKQSDEDKEDQSDKKKTYNIDLLNHVSLEESRKHEYRSAVLDRIHIMMVRYLANQSHKIAFPELVFLPMVQLKKWLKRNPGPAAQQFKTLSDKIKDDSQKVEELRKSVTFAFNDYSAVDAWQKKLKDTNRLSLPKLLSKKI